MARIAYCTPGLGPWGGIGIIVEHASRLAAPPWINVNVPTVPLAVAQGARPFDAVVATGFQTVQWSLQVPAVHRYYFVQMMEHNQMRQLYSRALFLLKASRYEGRACAPVEAMSCGTTCARGYRTTA